MAANVPHYFSRPNPRVNPSLLILACLVLVFCLLPTTAEARTYSFPSVEIRASVLPDGSMEVIERRTVDFDGRFSGMYMWIRETGRTRVDSIRVLEDGDEYTLNPENSPGPAGTYFVRQETDQVYIDWSFEARDESRTFTVEYTMLDVVRVHDDVAELYHQFIGDSWDTGTDAASVLLTLPGGAERDDLRAWGHGPLHGEVVIEDGAQIRWVAEPLPANTFLEGRITFPPTLVPEAQVRTGREGLPGILEEEGRWASAANRARFLSRADWVLGPLFLLLGPFLAFYFWWKYGKEFRPRFDGDYYRDLPGDYSPAELGVLWRFGSPNSEDFTATIMDLARRGWIRLEEYEREERSLFRTKTRTDFRAVRLEGEDDLRGHERSAMAFLFQDAAAGSGEIAFADLEAYTKRNRQRSAAFWSKWVAEVSAQGDQLGFFDTTTRRAQVLEIALGVLMAVGGIGALILLSMPLMGVGALLGGGALALAAVLLRRRSVTGVEDFTRWRAFRRFLLHFSEMQRHTVPSLVIWEHYLVYAVTLGVAKEVLRQLELVFPNLEQDGHRFGAGWLYMSSARGVGAANLAGGITSMTSGLQQSMRQAMAPASSGSGGGGGFSGGGGGGSGGGGGGVR